MPLPLPVERLGIAPEGVDERIQYVYVPVLSSEIGILFCANSDLETGAHARMQPTAEVINASHGAYQVHAWEKPPARYVALVSHGLGEHSRRYDHLAAALVADGAAVYAPDHYGHGRSAGEPALVEDVEAYVDDLHLIAERARAAHPGVALVLIGHSLGGMIATRYAQRHGSELAALVLSAPLLGSNPAFAQLLSLDPLPDVPIDPATLSRDPAVGQRYAADELVYHGPLHRQTLETLLAAVQTIAGGPKLDLPTLWLHGEADPLVPYSITREGIERLRTPQLSEKAYAGALHEIFNETNQDEVIADAIAFIGAHVSARRGR
jgi:alpha-beta hydrolase superfamily lysophospholipase